MVNELNKKATKKEVAAVASGSPAGVYATVAVLTTADPDHSKIYVVTADNIKRKYNIILGTYYRYYWTLDFLN